MSKTVEELTLELQTLRQEYNVLKARYEDEITIRSERTSDLPINGAGISVESIGPVDISPFRQLFDDYLKMYAGRDDRLTTCFSDNFSGFTGGGDFLVKNREEWVAITRQDFAQIPEPIHIDLKDLSIQSLSENIVVTTGFFTINLPIEDHPLSRETARLVLIFRKETSGWKITHSSISIPYYLVARGEVYPVKGLLERNQSLEKLAAERTIQYAEANDKLQKANVELANEIAEHQRTLEQLRDSEQKYRLLIDSATEAIVVVQDGRFQLFNPVVLEMTGYSAEEFDTLPFEILIHPDDKSEVMDNLKKRLHGEDIFSFNTFRLLTRNGKVRWVYLNAVLINWDGAPATLNFLTDVTSHRLAEEALRQSNQKWEAVMEVSPDGIGLITLDGKVLQISDKIGLMHGFTPEEKKNFLGTSVFDFIDPSHHEILLENTRKLLAGEKEKEITEYVALRRDRSSFNIDINARILRDSTGRPSAILYVERDISERKKVQEEIIQINHELAEINATKDKFFSIIAHDMKNHFHGLIGYSGILQTDAETLTESERASFVGTIHELSKGLYRLLENLLEWSRIQTGQMTFRPEEFNLLVELYPTLTLIKQTAKNKNVDFTYSIDGALYVIADTYMLSTIIRNLVVNSIKFTNPGGWVTLTAHKTGDQTVFTVCDSGVGINRETMDNLFKIDRTISTEGTANEKGTGLGLLLCKEMVEIHGGHIHVESEEGLGSTFSFTI